MNVFRLAPDPADAARMHCDEHVVKMCLEAGQLLCTALRRAGYDETQMLYEPTHTGHPLIGWIAEGRQNYRWVYQLCESLAREKRYRFGGGHSTWDDVISQLPRQPQCLPSGASNQYLAMPEEYADPSDTVASYRAYYRAEKGFASWDSGREPPGWL